MHANLRYALLTLTTLAAPLAANAAAPTLSVTVDGIKNGAPIPTENARCLATPDGKSDKNGQNLRPTISWADAPKETKSFAIFVMDPDVPADFTDAGKEGKIIPAKAKRQDFFHYGVTDIPIIASRLKGGDVKDDTIKLGNELTNDMGKNGYVDALGLYGGPCPPWNDERVHHYHFMVFALDTAPATAPSKSSAKETFTQLINSKHVLAKATVVGTYTLNPKIK